MADTAPVVAVFGATALGKTEVALRLAERLGAEIVVADSMQVYAGLALVTNQLGAAQRARVPQHLVGFVAPQQEFTAAEYARRAHEVIDGLRAHGRRVIVEGGSGLYLRAALGDLEFPGGEGDRVLRVTLEARWARDPREVVAELEARDPVTCARLDARNPRRVIRALEAVSGLGRPLAVAERDRLWRPAERYPHRLVALVPDEDREALKAVIDRRVDAMLAAGALDEVAAARAAGPLSRTVLQAIGVAELSAVLDGAMSFEDAARRMKSRSRALVRRQLTWMRKLPDAALVPVAGRDADEVAASVLDLLA
ncbi:MAG TPA: tRNA (adenosine(37)-N6)-dimethylallyltransferase MiaA [Thermoleophilia bacterium]|nr:tRNA (adenosine(37)-N6)-dimethylallyltransferase MiaA [Thermoleophilia bacterium]